jgi:large subunit ribosomal protein L25
MSLNDTLHLSDVPLPAGVTIPELAHRNPVAVSVHSPRVAEPEPEAVAATAEGAVAAPAAAAGAAAGATEGATAGKKEEPKKEEAKKEAAPKDKGGKK